MDNRDNRYHKSRVRRRRWPPRFESKLGVHRIENKYDDRNRLVEKRAYFDEDDKPERLRSGYHSIRSSYDERDNVTEQAVFDTSGNPAVDESINCHAYPADF